jgi:hypothetical protein
VSGPFDLADDAAYQAWRAFKLSRAPAIPENLIVPVTRLAEPTERERTALQARLLSAPDVFTCSYRLQAGEGIVANNPLHNRSGFIDGEDGQPKRLLIRVRYLDAIASVT